MNQHRYILSENLAGPENGILWINVDPQPPKEKVFFENLKDGSRLTVVPDEVVGKESASKAIVFRCPYLPGDEIIGCERWLVWKHKDSEHEIYTLLTAVNNLLNLKNYNATEHYAETMPLNISGARVWTVKKVLDVELRDTGKSVPGLNDKFTMKDVKKWIVEKWQWKIKIEIIKGEL